MIVLLLWLTLSTIWSGIISPTRQSRVWMQHLQNFVSRFPEILTMSPVTGGELVLKVVPQLLRKDLLVVGEGDEDVIWEAPVF